MKTRPIGTSPREAAEQRLAEEQAKRMEAIQERDDAEARGEAMFEKLQPALVIAEAEIARLQAALREVRHFLIKWDDIGNVYREPKTEWSYGEFKSEVEKIDAALSGKGEK